MIITQQGIYNDNSGGTWTYIGGGEYMNNKTGAVTSDVSLAVNDNLSILGGTLDEINSGSFGCSNCTELPEVTIFAGNSSSYRMAARSIMENIYATEWYSISNRYPKGMTSRYAQTQYDRWMRIEPNVRRETANTGKAILGSILAVTATPIIAVEVGVGIINANKIYGFRFAKHSAHHYFRIFNKRLPHFQLNTWMKGVKGSGETIFRIPWFW